MNLEQERRALLNNLWRMHNDNIANGLRFTHHGIYKVNQAGIEANRQKLFEIYRKERRQRRVTA